MACERLYQIPSIALSLFIVSSIRDAIPHIKSFVEKFYLPSIEVKNNNYKLVNQLNEETETIIIVSVFSGAWFVLLLVCIVLCTQVSSLRRKIHDLNNTGRLRVQKLKMSPEGNHAFNNPALSPDEELARRGFSMYQGSEGDLESGRGTDRQTSGQFVEELSRKIDDRQQRQSQANGQPPPFLLQSIEDNKKKTRNMVNPVANPSRHSSTNPNFIY